MVNAILAVVVYGAYSVRLAFTSNRAERFALIGKCERTLDGLAKRCE